MGQQDSEGLPHQGLCRQRAHAKGADRRAASAGRNAWAYIAATLFLWFLNNNGILYRKDGSKRLADNTLVALTLMIAESKTEEKDVMVKVVVNLINQRNY